VLEANRHDPDYVRTREPDMRVAVTGASGLVGRPLVAALARDDGVEEVLAIDVRPPGSPPVPRVRTIERDTRDPRLAADLAGSDALVHLAFRVLDARDAVAVNVDGSRNVFEAAIAGGAGTIVHASSGAVYGAAPDNPVPLTEEQPLRASTSFFYPRTKEIVEGMLDDLGARHPGVRIARLRPTTILAPGAPLLFGRRAYVTFSDFDPPMQFTWVDDVVAAFVSALHNQAATGAFNLGAPGTVRSSDVARILGVRSIRLPYSARRAAAAAMSRLRIPGGLHPGFVEMNRYPIVVASARAEVELGWRPGCDSLGALRRFGETL
jgi:UDP-glucose 4-epimerase